MNKEKSKLNSDEDRLEAVAPSNSKLRELLDWLKQEKGLSVNQIAQKSGLFVRATITELLKKPQPNPGLDVIHGIAKVGEIPEQMVIDACLGRPFWKKERIEAESLKQTLREYEALKPENRSDSLQYTLSILKKQVAELLEAQEKPGNKTRR